MKQLSFTDVPADWAICLQEHCPLADTCLRHDAGMMMPANTCQHNIVLPTARQGDDDKCRLYASNKPVPIARGMFATFKVVQPHEAAKIRARLFNVFGSRATYFRHQRGDYDITPVMQERVAAVFSEFGYNEPLVFDHAAEQYFFPNK